MTKRQTFKIGDPVYSRCHGWGDVQKVAADVFGAILVKFSHTTLWQPDFALFTRFVPSKRREHYARFCNRASEAN